MTAVDFYVDPACPWTFATAQWVADIAKDRDLDISWRTFSLRHTNRNNPNLPASIAEKLAAQQRGLRILQHTVAGGDRERSTAVYFELAERIHLSGDTHLATLPDAIAAAGLAATSIDLADDTTLDAGIIASTEAGQALVGTDVGVPIIAMADAPATFFGPVLSSMPAHADGLALWDAFAALTRIENVYEIKRSRTIQQPALQPARSQRG
jgi:hypothetical protein